MTWENARPKDCLNATGCKLQMHDPGNEGQRATTDPKGKEMHEAQEVARDG